MPPSGDIRIFLAFVVALGVATGPDLAVASAAIRIAKQLIPSAHVIARVGVHGEGFTLRNAGASEVVRPEFEVGLGFAR